VSSSVDQPRDEAIHLALCDLPVLHRSPLPVTRIVLACPVCALPEAVTRVGALRTVSRLSAGETTVAGRALAVTFPQVPVVVETVGASFATADVRTWVVCSASVHFRIGNECGPAGSWFAAFCARVLFFSRRV
jgi:hypothetical protein